LPSAKRGTGERGERRQSMTTIRKKIAERLVQSQKTTATLTTFNEIDMSAVMALRERYKDKFKERYGLSLGFMGFFVKACVEALKHVPQVNAFLEGTDVIYHDYANIGVAVGTEKGLIVPVIKDADQLSIAEVEQAIRHYALKARDGKISIDDLSGGTFTVSNGGVYGSLMSTPILNPPQSGILGMHKIEERPMAINGKVEIRPMMYVALSYDHRIIDGKEAVTFLVKVKEGIEDPTRLLLEI
jgi:2-oxoglutarate dehydrogenase E2 component (dihydrolipoamide succinyltransferase)